jgi:ATP-dependent Clp protease ATP-binding subunit ClpA
MGETALSNRLSSCVLTPRANGLRYGDDLRVFLMYQGFDAEFGARPLRRAIQTHVDDALADAILAGDLKPGQTAILTVEGDAVKVTAEGEPLCPSSSARPSVPKPPNHPQPTD